MTTFVRYGNACAIDSQVTSSAGTISYGHPKVLVVDHMLAHGKHTFMFTGEMTNLNEIADAILCGTMLDRPDLMGDQCVFHIDHGSAQITEYHSEGACDPVRRVTPPDICAAGSARKAAMCMAIAAHEGSIWRANPRATLRPTSSKPCPKSAHSLAAMSIWF